MIHALNTVHIKDLNKWIRPDAWGNKENINAYFSLDEEHLAHTRQNGTVNNSYKSIDFVLPAKHATSADTNTKI